MERRRREDRRKAIQEFWKTWLKAKEEELKDQRSTAVRKAVLDQEKRALRACIQRVNNTRHGFDDTHTIIALLRALMRMYHKEAKEDVSKIPTLRVDRDRVLAKGRQGFLRELYGMARDKSSTWEWPSECNATFQRELKQCFEEAESGDVTDRKELMLSIAQQMSQSRERIDREYKEKKERERQQELLARHAPSPPPPQPQPLVVVPRSIAPPRAIISGGGSGPVGFPGSNGIGPPSSTISYQQVTYQRITVTTFTRFVCNGATSWQ